MKMRSWTQGADRNRRKPRKTRGGGPGRSRRGGGKAGRAGRFRPEGLARLLGALAHVKRLQILVKLLEGLSDHRTLAKLTRLKAGPLYHHLRELRLAGLIGPKVRDQYVITSSGRRVTRAAMALGRTAR
ncbi:MAG: hypothetical protein AMXMBFR83_24730 [Phycisphaerae bacterium]